MEQRRAERGSLSQGTSDEHSSGGRTSPGWPREHLKSTPNGTVATPQRSQQGLCLPRWLLFPQHGHGCRSPGRLHLRPGGTPASRRRAAAAHTDTTQQPLTRMVPCLPPARKVKRTPFVLPSLVLGPGSHPEKEAAQAKQSSVIPSGSRAGDVGLGWTQARSR